MSSEATELLGVSEDEVRSRSDKAAAACDRVLDVFETVCPPGVNLCSFVDELTAEVLAGSYDSVITDTFDPAAGTPQKASIILHEDRFCLALAEAANKRLV